MFFDLIINSPVPPLYGLLALILILLSITFHEFAHAFVSNALGDPTPRLTGRLTLNPLAHLDLFGTLFMLFGQFGWGKPVQVNPRAYDEPYKGWALVSLAGPLTNIAFAVVLIGVLKLIGLFLSGLTLVYVQFALSTTIVASITLAFFNLLPVFPLDGEKIVTYLLPLGKRHYFQTFMQKYGFFILVALILPIFPGGYSVVSYILAPVQSIVINLLSIVA